MVKLSKNIFKPVARSRPTSLGAAGYDNARENIDPHIKTKVVSTKEIRTGAILTDTIYHAYGGFQDLDYLLALGADTWTFITNISSDLWTGLEADGIEVNDDRICILNKGDYTGVLSITFEGGTGKDYLHRIYNVTQDRVEGYHIGASGAGNGNFVNACIPIYLEAEDNDEFELQVKSDGTDITYHNSVFHISYLHN